MDRVTSIQQYKNIISNAKQNEYKLTNCFFLTADIIQKIAKGKLLYEYISNGLLLFDDLNNFYRCYYFLSAKGVTKEVKLDKNTVIEFPFNGKLNEKQNLQVKKIESMGFLLGRKSSMMICAPDKIVASNMELQDDICCLAETCEAEDILCLMSRIFNPLYSFLPTIEDIHNYIKNGNVIVIRDGRKIAGALISGFEKKIATIKQIAVDPNYRGKNFGKYLLQSYHDKYKYEASSFQHWVDLNNFSAINMYVNFGYEFGFRKANEYIFIVKEK